MKLTLGEIASAIGGEFDGDKALEITGVASLAEATPSELSFFYHPRYLNALRQTHAAAVIVPADFSEEIGSAVIRAQDPAKAFEQIALRFAPKPITFAPGIHPSAVIAATAKIGARVSVQPHVVIEAGAQIGDDTIIGAGCYIGHEVVIGAKCFLYPRVTIRERCQLGARVILHSGVVIGADGFGFEMTASGQQKVPQFGIVQLDDDVEVGANSTIDRARFGRTWVQKSAKIDNHVQIAHNVIIGENTVIAAQSAIAGSTRLGSRVMVGGQAGFAGHLEIGDGTMIGAQAGVGKNIHGGVWSDSPAVPLRESRKAKAWNNRIGEMLQRLKALERKLGL